VSVAGPASLVRPCTHSRPLRVLEQWHECSSKRGTRCAGDDSRRGSPCHGPALALPLMAVHTRDAGAPNRHGSASGSLDLGSGVASRRGVGRGAASGPALDQGRTCSATSGVRTAAFPVDSSRSGGAAQRVEAGDVLRIAVVEEQAAANIECRDLAHVFLGQFEAKDIEVLGHPVLAD